MTGTSSLRIHQDRQEIHDELLLVLEWINKDLPEWLTEIDRFENVQEQIKIEMGWL